MDYPAVLTELRAMVLHPAPASSLMVYGPLAIWRKGREEGQKWLSTHKVWTGGVYVRRGQVPQAGDEGWEWGRQAKLQCPWPDKKKPSTAGGIHRYREWKVDEFAKHLNEEQTASLVDLLVFVGKHRQARLYIRAEFVEPGDITE